MDVVLINNDYPPIIFGGIGTFTHELAKGLVRKGHRVTVITGYPQITLSANNKYYEEIADGINIIRLPYPSMAPRHTLFQLFNYKKIINIIKNINPDIIHGQSGSLYPLIVNLRSIIPVLVTFHSSPAMEKMTSAQSILHGGTTKDFFTYLLGYPGFRFPYQKELQYSDGATTVSN